MCWNKTDNPLILHTSNGSMIKILCATVMRTTPQEVILDRETHLNQLSHVTVQER